MPDRGVRILQPGDYRRGGHVQSQAFKGVPGIPGESSIWDQTCQEQRYSWPGICSHLRESLADRAFVLRCGVGQCQHERGDSLLPDPRQRICGKRELVGFGTNKELAQVWNGCLGVRPQNTKRFHGPDSTCEVFIHRWLPAKCQLSPGFRWRIDKLEWSSAEKETQCIPADAEWRSFQFRLWPRPIRLLSARIKDGTVAGNQMTQGELTTRRWIEIGIEEHGNHQQQSCDGDQDLEAPMHPAPLKQTLPGMNRRMYPEGCALARAGECGQNPSPEPTDKHVIARQTGRQRRL